MKKTLIAAAIFAAPLTANAAFMEADWAAKACDAWNASATLTNELGGDAWGGNDGGRGYKTISSYRTHCGEGSMTQMTIENKGGKAMCTYGGKPDGKAFDSSHDYIMHASDENWTEMGNGDYGPMKAMMFGRLKFTGPKMEAMSVMGPFEQYLLLTGTVAGDKSACPQ